jgi:2-methylcitrate dehydratase PrpD
MDTLHEIRATASMAAFIASYPRSDISPAETLAARHSLIDTVFSAAVGSSSELGKKLLSPAASSAMSGNVQVLGTSHMANSSWAAFLFGALDDWAGYGPGGAPVWGALLALAQAEGPDDELSLLDAFCVGVKAAHALFRAGRYSQAERGLDGTSVFGSIASTAASARLLGLSTDKAASALATVASEFGGPIANRGTEAGDAYAGFAAKNGLQAALLARQEFYGAPDILEGAQGFGDAVFDRAEAKLLALNDVLTSPVNIAEAVRFKQSACNIDHQRAVATLAGLLSSNSISVSGAIEIGVEGVPPAIEGVRFDIPSTADEARSSLRSSLARAALEGSVNAQQLRDGMLFTPEFADAAAKVRVGIVSRWEPRLFDSEDEATSVWVKTKDGSIFSADPRDQPLSLEADGLLEKWKTMTSPASPGRTSSGWLSDAVGHWEELSSNSASYDATEIVGLRR